ncbi:hypothetical protein [Streptomyces sp. B21-083]|uniref:hypothetical protein n=1 Tax=Streptomyces sp. B21-083 TaxID=3039410 RepID=UPI002FF3C7A6
MTGEIRPQGTEVVYRTGSSEARRSLSGLFEAFGVDGVLLVRKSEPGAEEADVAPGSGLKPGCRCGGPKCPDYEAVPKRPAEELSAKVAEANRRSRRGGT